MKDLMELCCGVADAEKGKVVMEEIVKEIEKGTDLSPYLTLMFLPKEKSYQVILRLPISSHIFDSHTSNQEIQMQQKAIDCMVQNFKTFFEQAAAEVVADFGEPCATCPYARNCDFNWLSIMQPLFSKSAIHLRLGRPERLNKLDIPLHKDIPQK